MFTRCAATTVLALLVALPAAAQDLPPATGSDARITLSAVKERVLVGEFTKVKADWLILRQVGIRFGGEYLQVDDGSGFRDHAEGSIEEKTVARAVEVLAAGDTRTSEYVIGVNQIEPIGGLSAEELNASFQLAFPQPGTYFVKLRYDDVESNTVPIEVVAPSGTDADVLAAIRANIGVLTDYVRSPTVIQRSEELVTTYGGHKYLAHVFRALNGEESLYEIDQATFDRRSAVDFSDSVFAADEALWQARVGRHLFGDAWARSALQRIVSLFPGREPALYAAAELRALDDQPPVLTLAAAPSGLWPPNNRLVPVRAVISVRDEVDQAPVVELESITCDDGCDPASDIQQATFGTNDIEFLLRSKRSGGGPGRTYTITYRARDAVGNSTTATTAVLVPHDQGR